LKFGSRFRFWSRCEVMATQISVVCPAVLTSFVQSGILCVRLAPATVIVAGIGGIFATRAVFLSGGGDSRISPYLSGSTTSAIPLPAPELWYASLPLLYCNLSCSRDHLVVVICLTDVCWYLVCLPCRSLSKSAGPQRIHNCLHSGEALVTAQSVRAIGEVARTSDKLDLPCVSSIYCSFSQLLRSTACLVLAALRMQPPQHGSNGVERLWI
jgi:hypothetical protein